MEQAKASGKILIVDLIMSIFLWSQIFRAILALQKKKKTLPCAYDMRLVA